MRLITGISIATLAVSVAALALVLWLVVTEPWEPDAQAATPDVQSANEEHTRELDADAVRWLIYDHASQLIESEGLKDKTLSDDDLEILSESPGFKCFWEPWYNFGSGTQTSVPDVSRLNDVSRSGDSRLTYNYIEKDDVWLVTSVKSGCENNLETWTIDDNTGAITYGRLP